MFDLPDSGERPQASASESESHTSSDPSATPGGLATDPPSAASAGRDADIWMIVERFFSAQAIYKRQYDRYEELVAKYVSQFGMPRQEIRLEPAELSGLLRFKEMERLRDEYLLPLKRATHSLFRTTDATDYLDRLVNDIFHEISILKEEHYNVLTYSAGVEERGARAELETILDEVHTMFPIKVHRLKHLFEEARERLETILPSFRSSVVLIRSLFLYRDDFVAAAYPDGLLGFYRSIYGDAHVYEGFRDVGDSFSASGFYESAIAGYQAGLEFLEEDTSDLDPAWRDAQAYFAGRIAKCEADLATLDEEEDGSNAQGESNA